MQEVDAASLGLSGKRRYWVRGVVPPAPRVAVVGARAARFPLANAVEPIVAALAECGCALVSGGALGVDALAHRAALAKGLPQIAVLPCGPDRVYPSTHGPLFDRVAQGGAVVYGLAPGTAPTRGTFASRNALVVALSQVVVIVQAGLRSGSLLTGQLALRRGVEVLAIPNSPGCARLVGAGARSLAWNPSRPDQLQEHLLRRLRGEPDDVARWPEAFAELEALVGDRGEVGVDDFGDPLLAAGLLADAEAAGLVREARPGRFVAVG